MNPLVIAIDSSTTATKAIVVDTEGKVLALGRQDIDLLSPEQGFGEHDPRQWWTSTRDAVAQALAQLTPAEKERIAAFGITHQRESFAPFAADGTPLRNGILWLDIRAADQVQRYGTPEIHALSGRPADVTPGLYKMAWLKENEPESLAKADKVTTVSAYIAFCLTGQWVDSAACADSLSLSNIKTLEYDDGLLQIAGVRREQMADLVKPGQTLGTLKKSVAEEWGIGEIPIVAGCGDGQAAGVGAAAVTPDVAYLNMGTAVVAGVPSAEYRYEKLFRTEAAGVPDTYVLELVQNSGAYLSGWFRRAFGKPELAGAPDPELEALAAARTPGSGGLVTMPYWGAALGPDRPRRRRRLARNPRQGLDVPLDPGGHQPGDGPLAAQAGGIDRRRADNGPRDGRRAAFAAVAPDHDRRDRPADHRLRRRGDLRAGRRGHRHGLHRRVRRRRRRHGCPEDGQVHRRDRAEHEIYNELSAIQDRLYDNLRETNARLYEFSRKHPDAELTGGEG